MHGNTKLTPDVKADIIRCINGTMKQAEIVRKHHLAKSTISLYVQLVKAELQKENPELIKNAPAKTTTLQAKEEKYINALIREKLVILEDFGIVNSQNRQAMKGLLQACKSQNELDRVCHKLIYEKLK